MPTNTVSGAHTVLVTLFESATVGANDRGCALSFTANNGATAASGVSIATAADNHAFAPGIDKANSVMAGSASFVVTTAAGTTTFTGAFRVTNGGATCTIASGASIIVQVYG